MKFISAEEFLKQDEDVQRVFTDYFDYKEMLFKDGIMYFGIFSYLYTPLLTEGDLREFIEDKTGDKIEINYHSNGEYTIDLFNQITNKYNRHYNLGNISIDLLQAYWQVAVKIASEEVSNE